MSTLKRENGLYIATNQFGEVCAYTTLKNAFTFFAIGFGAGKRRLLIVTQLPSEYKLNNGLPSVQLKTQFTD